MKHFVRIGFLSMYSSHKAWIKDKTKVADFIKNDTNAVLFSDGEIKSLAGITAEPQNGLVWRFFIDYETPIPANGDYILNDGEIITFNLDYVN